MKGAIKKINSLHQDPEAVIKKIGAMLRERRERLGYTSHEPFAHEIPMDRSQYGKYEVGKDMQISTLLRIVNAMGLTLEDFFSKEA